MAKQTDRERIADALYMLAAGANQVVLMDTLRAYVVAHSKEQSDVLALLRELHEAQPTLTVTAIKRIKPTKKPNAKRKSTRATTRTHRASVRT